MDRFILSAIVFGKLVVCYLIAALVQHAFALWPNFDGHPHIPFSAYPWSLIFAPMLPVDTMLEFKKTGFDARLVREILVFGAAFMASGVALFVLPRAQRKNKSKLIK